LAPLAIIFTGVTARAIVMCVVLYVVRMFIITAGYHRYFSHRSYQMNRFWTCMMAIAGTTCGQKGALWWASNHVNHHRYSDTERDPHTPTKGFWWSHVLWILCDKYTPTVHENVEYFERFPELRFVEKWNAVGIWVLGAGCFLVGGWSGLVVGFFLSTVLLWHATFTVNSLAHIWGTRRYATKAPDTSRNNPLIALYTGGEGWHNNHHKYSKSVRQGFVWWQIDTTYYVLWLLSKVGIVKQLNSPPRSVVEAGYGPNRERI